MSTERSEKKRYRVAVAGIHHESNTFNPIITGFDDFNILRGKRIIESVNDSDSVSGIIKTLGAREDIETVPILMARAVPNGVVSYDLYRCLLGEILEGIELSGPLDAIVFSLHGSMRVERIGDAEGHLLEAVRKIEPGIPVSVSLDMHATMTEAMMRNSDAMVGYKTAPHVDCFETGAHAARMCLWMLDTGRKPYMSFHRVPMMIAGEKSETSCEPMKSLMRILHEREKDERVLAATFLLGFPWADNEDNGVVSLVVASDSMDRAERESADLAKTFWDERARFSFHTESYEPSEALRIAVEASMSDRPVYISDSGDNPTAGSTADCTNFLKLILGEESVRGRKMLYAGFYDPKAVTACFGVPKGQSIGIHIGAAFDTVTSRGVFVNGRVAASRPAWGSYSAHIVLFRTDVLDIIITDKHIGFVSTDMLYDLGVKPEDYDIVVVKLGYLTPDHKNAAKRSIMALTDGSSNELLENLRYTRINRPMYPFDANVLFT